MSGDGAPTKNSTNLRSTFLAASASMPRQRCSASAHDNGTAEGERQPDIGPASMSGSDNSRVTHFAAHNAWDVAVDGD